MAYVYQLAPVREAFEDYIDTEIPNVTSDVYHCRNYEEFKNDWSQYEKIRAMTSVINWKSSIGGSDSTRNFRTKLDVDLRRGDYIYDIPSGVIGMITWNVDNMPDCKKTQVSSCNIYTTVYRKVGQTLDDDARVIEEAHEEIIAENYPAVYAGMYGRYDYEQRMNTPGIFPDQKIEVKIQFNDVTKQIESGDLLDIHGVQHRVIFTTYSFVDIDCDGGYIILTCERAAG